MSQPPHQRPKCSICGSTDDSVRASEHGHLCCDSCWFTRQGELDRKSVEKPPETSPETSPSYLPGHLSGATDISWEMPSASGDTSYGVDRTAVRATVLGIPGPKRGPGRCVLPGHAHTSHLHPGKVGWLYWCAACDKSFSLAQVRAIIAYQDVPYGDNRDENLAPAWQRIRPPGRVEVSRWAELLDFEAGLLIPREVDLQLPLDLSPTARHVAAAIRLLLGLRSERWTDRDKFTFSRRMCRARCGLSDGRARAALTELRERGVLSRSGGLGGRLSICSARRKMTSERLRIAWRDGLRSRAERKARQMPDRRFSRARRAETGRLETQTARLAYSRAEAAAALGVSVDFFDEHIAHEVRAVRRGRRRLYPVRELVRWLDQAASLAVEDR